jgi:hypothetical protein
MTREANDVRSMIERAVCTSSPTTGGTFLMVSGGSLTTAVCSAPIGGFRTTTACGVGRFLTAVESCAAREEHGRRRSAAAIDRAHIQHPALTALSRSGKYA